MFNKCFGKLTGLLPGRTYFFGIIELKSFDIQNRGSIRSSISTFETIVRIPVIRAGSNPPSFGANSASLNYQISDFGSVSIQETGLCYSTSTNPTVNDLKYKMDSLNNYTCGNPLSKPDVVIHGIMYPLSANTTYYVRPYAVNGAGVGYGTQYSFKTLENTSCFLNPIDLIGSGGNISSIRRIEDPGGSNRILLYTSASGINGNLTRSYLYSIGNDGKLRDDIIFRSLACGSGGYTMSPAGNSIEILSDGKMLVNMSSLSSQNILYRLNKDGSIDNSFNVSTNSSNKTHLFKTISDGSIYIAGSFSLVQGVPFYDIVKLNPDGSVNQSFQYKGGRLTQLFDLDISPDGKPIIAATVDGIRKIIRLHNNGSIDSSFKLTVTGITRINSILSLTDGKILVSIENPTARLYRFNQDGSIDNTFSVGVFNGSTSIIYRNQNNKIFVGGSFTSFNNSNAFGVVKLNLDGTRDNTFNVSRQFTTKAIYESSDGKLILGIFESPFFVQLNSNGSLCR